MITLFQNEYFSTVRNNILAKLKKKKKWLTLQRESDVLKLMGSGTVRFYLHSFLNFNR